MHMHDSCKVKTEHANKQPHSRLQETLMSKASMSLKMESGSYCSRGVSKFSFLQTSQGVALVKAASCSMFFVETEIVAPDAWMCSGHPQVSALKNGRCCSRGRQGLF